ncbi:MAG: hypothetical protein KF915_09295 [Polyangiaceae bacterium]|nr:hypothetical protein [Polyangiaceae bacterium]
MIDDALAVFVSPAGRADAAGTQADPLGSVQAGLAKAKGDGKRLYVCADGGDFDENLSLDNQLVGVAVWGGFKCDGWRFDATLRATVAPTSGVPLTAKDVYVASSFQYMRFKAPQGVAEGESSIAGFVANSTALSFERVEFIAQEGAKGADGKRSDVTEADLAPEGVDINGRDGKLWTGGASVEATCTRTGESTTGGRGQDRDIPASPGLPTLDSPNPDGGSAGDGYCAQGQGGGVTGNPGAPGESGDGAAAWGRLTVSAWTPASGEAGRYGQVGQGGGGGSMFETNTASAGGGGGAGGCGGAPGGAGGGGGASVALLLFNAPVTLRDVQLTAADAGDGGAGHAGQVGLAGGERGKGIGCTGGRGGSGGDGGAGGGGAGGISAGVLHVGTAPTRTGGHILVGQAGAAGPGGSADGSNAGIAGHAAEVVPL